MAALTGLAKFCGRWQGTNRLWLQPGEPVHESASSAEIRVIAQEQFIEMVYTWSEAGKLQEGRLFLVQTPGSREVKAVWLDTWHLSHQFMTFAGEVDDAGAVTVKGTYPAPEGPDWGWQITLVSGDGSWRLQMDNITPAGEAFLAVETIYLPG